MIYWFSFLILIISLSIDTFIAGFSIGSCKIKVPMFSIIVICIINTIILIISCLFGKFIQPFLLNNWITFLSSIPFLILGFCKIYDSTTKMSFKNEKDNTSKLKCFIKVFYEPSKVDFDFSKTLSFKELFLLSISLSLDNLAAGLGISMKNNSLYIISIINFIISFFFFTTGNRLFYKLTTYKINWSLIGGITLVLIGIYRIFH